MESRETEQRAAGVAANGKGQPSPEPQDEDEARTGPRKRVVFGIIGTIVAVLVIFYGVKYVMYARVHESTDDARVDANAVEVNSKISERVDAILVQTDQPVHRGQLLIVLDARDEQSKVAQAQADYDLAVANQRTLTSQGQGGVSQATAQIAGTQATVSAAEAQLAQARAQVPAAQQAYDEAEADLARTASLVSTGDVPKQNLDAAKAAAAQAAAQLRVARDAIASASAGVNAAVQQVSGAQGGLQTARGKLAQSTDPSQVEAQQAELALAKQNLAYTKIYSSIDGYVGEKSIEVGQTVSPGMPLLTLIPNDVFITANYKETQVGAMHAGQPTDITVDAYKGVTFHGIVLSINPASQNTYALVPAQNATGNFVKVTQRIPVKIGFSSYDAARYPMRVGMSVETSVKVR